MTISTFLVCTLIAVPASEAAGERVDPRPVFLAASRDAMDSAELRPVLNAIRQSPPADWSRMERHGFVVVSRPGADFLFHRSLSRTANLIDSPRFREVLASAHGNLEFRLADLPQAHRQAIGDILAAGPVWASVLPDLVRSGELEVTLEVETTVEIDSPSGRRIVRLSGSEPAIHGSPAHASFVRTLAELPARESHPMPSTDAVFTLIWRAESAADGLSVKLPTDAELQTAAGEAQRLLATLVRNDLMRSLIDSNPAAFALPVAPGTALGGPQLQGLRLRPSYLPAQGGEPFVVFDGPVRVLHHDLFLRYRVMGNEIGFGLGAAVGMRR